MRPLRVTAQPVSAAAEESGIGSSSGIRLGFLGHGQAERVEHGACVVLGFDAEDFHEVCADEEAGEDVDEDVGALGGVLADEASVGDAAEQTEGHERQPRDGPAVVVVAEARERHDHEDRHEDCGLHLHEGQVPLQDLELGLQVRALLLLARLLVHHLILGRVDLLLRRLYLFREVFELRLAVDQEVVRAW